MFSLVVLSLAWAGCASSAQATPQTRKSLDREIRQCFLDRGAHAHLTREGGSAWWDKTGIHWAAWSYMRYQGKDAVIGMWNQNLSRKQKQAAKFCLRWPR